MEHQFTVPGHCVPYTRTTQRGKYVSKQWKRYAKYKDKIFSSFVNSVTDKKLKRKYLCNYTQHGKPILNSGVKMYVWTKVFFKHRRHGDIDNIHKGCLDALFVSDKYVVGAYDFGYDEDCPRLEVLVTDNAKKFKDTLKAKYDLFKRG